MSESAWEVSILPMLKHPQQQHNVLYKSPYYVFWWLEYLIFFLKLSLNFSPGILTYWSESNWSSWGHIEYMGLIILPPDHTIICPNIAFPG